MNNNRPYTFSRKKKRFLISYTCPDFRDCYGINIDYIRSGRSRKKEEDRGQKTEDRRQKTEDKEHPVGAAFSRDLDYDFYDLNDFNG